MKKFIAMMLCIVLVLSLVACGKDAEEPTETTTEPTTETTEAPTTEAPTTEEVTEEITEEIPSEEEVIERAPEDIWFIQRDAEWNETQIEPNETMLLLASLYDDYPADQRAAFLNIRELTTVEEYEMNYLPTDIEGLVVTVCEPGMTLAHFTSIITVPDGIDPQTVVDSIKSTIAEKDPDLRLKWFSHTAETCELVISGNRILYFLGDKAFAEHCVNAFNAKMAG